jgi:rsbT co-antagonist protein RsbR
MKAATPRSRIPEILRQSEAEVLSEWLEQQAQVKRPGRRGDGEAKEISRRFLQRFIAATAASLEDMSGPEWDELHTLVSEVSRSRLREGSTPAETATFVLSLKRPLFQALRKAIGGDVEALASELWTATTLLDHLGLHTMEVYQKGREEIIARQQQEMLELSTPVVQLWNSILALPLIGTLDSARTGVVMESMLQRIVDTGAQIAIIDITGVPTVDTLVAQHLLKTVAAARLMGADCIISGIRPQIAQTLVHLGVALNEVITKATLADAFRVALARTGQGIITLPERAVEA